MVKKPSIIKNSLFLFIRMIGTLIVSLYTVRVLLDVLGIVDFGIYNLIYGIITGVSFVSISLATAAQRFLSFDLGLQKYKQLNFTFSTIFNLFFIFSLFVCLLMFYLGPLIIPNINIPAYRLSDALLLFRITSLTFFFSLIIIPLNALVISYEKMAFFSYLTIFDVMAKLGTVYLLQVVEYNSLVFYGFLLLIIAILNFLIYLIYIRYGIKTVKYYLVIVNSRFREIFNFFKWNLFGSITTVANDQGINIVLNVFFGPAITGTRAVGNRLVNVLSQLCNTVFLAVSPQIIKSYASKDFNYTKKLIISSSKLTLYLILCVVIPLYFNMEFILELWLKTINDDLVLFSQVSILFVLLSCLENPLTQLVRAYGKIRLYQVSVGILTLLTLPISLILFTLDKQPIVIIWVLNCVYFLALFVRIYIVNMYLPLNIKEYIIEVIIKPLFVSLIAIAAIYYVLNFSLDTIFNRLAQTLVFIILYCLLIYTVGLNNSERSILLRYVKNNIK